MEFKETWEKFFKSILPKKKGFDFEQDNILPTSDSGKLFPSSGDASALARKLIENETENIGLQKKLTDHFSLTCLINAEDGNRIARILSILNENSPEDETLNSKNVSAMLADLFFYSSSFYLTQPKKKALLQEPINNYYSSIIAELIFSDPYYNCERNIADPALKNFLEEVFWKKNLLRLEASKFKYKFLNTSECLIYERLPNELFEGESGILKGNNVFWGPASFGMGKLISEAIMKHLFSGNEITTLKNREIIEKFLIDIYDTFEKRFQYDWDHDVLKEFTSIPVYREEYLKHFFSEMTGYIALIIISYIHGPMTVKCFRRINDPEKRRNMQITAMQLAVDMLMKRNYIQNMRSLMKFIFTYFQ